jgi:hypothetical protein
MNVIWNVCIEKDKINKKCGNRHQTFFIPYRNRTLFFEIKSLGFNGFEFRNFHVKKWQENASALKESPYDFKATRLIQEKRPCAPLVHT